MSSDQKTRLLPVHRDPSPYNGHGRASSTASTSSQTPKEDSVKAKYAWLTVYFALNLALTLYNKAVMGKVVYRDPYWLPFLHAGVDTHGC